MRNSAVFISYRRDDTGPIALALRSELDLRLRGATVFVDQNRIQGGAAWPDVLSDALAKSRLLIALIGDDWAAGRLAVPDDWVAREVGEGLQRNIVLPVLVNGARLPSDLPAGLAALAGVQALPLRIASWEADLKLLCDTLGARFGVPLKDARQMMPQANKIKRTVAALTNEELEAACADGPLQAWRVEMIHDVSVTGAVREFLCRTLLFQRDKDAFAFLAKVGSVVHKMNHHPVIEAKYADVGIKLSTWDAGHRITKYDLRLAHEIERLARRWKQRSPES